LQLLVHSEARRGVIAGFVSRLEISGPFLSGVYLVVEQVEISKSRQLPTDAYGLVQKTVVVFMLMMR
jgi:hypothetical protein